MNILEEIASYTKERIKQKKKSYPLEEIKQKALKLPIQENLFLKSLQKPTLSFICEIKKASPSKKIIDPVFDYLHIAHEYEQIGVDAISVLTEPKWFMGSDQYLEEITHQVKLPCLRKDFVIDKYMIYEAKILGAAAVLLIVSLLSLDELKQYLKICSLLGLVGVVEVHDEKEIQIALDAKAEVIGINNRFLKDFTVNLSRTISLKNKIPSNIYVISESGISSRKDILKLEEISVDGVLIGEVMMRSQNKKETLKELKSS